MTGEQLPRQKTRITCKEQLEFYFAYENLGRQPGLEFFKEEAQLDMELMESLEGKRSDDVVEMFKSIGEEEQREYGVPYAATEYKKKRDSE